MSIIVCTSNLLSTNLIVDICESEQEYSKRYKMAIEFYARSLIYTDFILVQEGDPEFYNVLSKTTKLRHLIHFMGPPNNPESKHLYIFYSSKWEIIEDLTDRCTMMYQSIHGRYPFRGILTRFKKVDGTICIIGNVHGSGYNQIITENVLTVMYGLISNSAEPVIIGGDMYVNPCAIRGIDGNYICTQSMYATAQHNYVYDPTSNLINYNKKTSMPDNFMFRGVSAGYMSLNSRTNSETPYSYNDGCIIPSNNSIDDMDKCRLSEPSAPTRISIVKPSHLMPVCRNQNRIYKPAHLSNWFSDHKALSVTFNVINVNPLSLKRKM